MSMIKNLPHKVQQVTVPAIALTIAGSDSGGGAGIQADLKTFALCDVFGVSVISAITAQNTQGVFDIAPIAPASIHAQLVAVADDFVIGATKIGMLGDVATIMAVKDFVQSHKARLGTLVLDPVMVAKGGAKLLADDALDALKQLLPLADIITPNLPEAAALVGQGVNVHDHEAVFDAWRALGVRDVIVKGGHRQDGNDGDKNCTDVAWIDGECIHLPAPRLDSCHTHGTGCSFSACLTAQLAKGVDKIHALQYAKCFIHHAIACPIVVGSGINPVNHWAGAKALKVLDKFLVKNL